MAADSSGNRDLSGSQASPDTASFTLHRLNDSDITKVTEFYQSRLLQAMEEGVTGVSSTLTYGKHFNEKEHRMVTELADKGQKAESSELLMDLTMANGPAAQRAMWDSFVNMRRGVPKLDTILKEVEKHGTTLPSYAVVTEVVSELPSKLHGVQKQHKEYLLKLTETFELKPSLTKKKVKLSQLGDRYTELTIISPIRQWRLVEHELLVRGKDHEECRESNLRRDLEKIRIGELFRSCFTREVRVVQRSNGQAEEFHSGCSAAACGVPGIGKTTLVQKITHDWAAGDLYQQFQFVFSFKFRDLNTIDGKVSLKHLVLHSYDYLEKIIDEIWKNPTVLLFIFDGFDEFKDNIDFDESGSGTERQHMCPDPDSCGEVSDIVYSLIQRKLLPGCSVLLTTRPTALYLLEKAQINLWVEILGFSGEERKDYFIKFFDKDEKVSSAFFKHMEENKILYTMSYNPSYCCILGQVLGPFFMQDEKRTLIPRTITQLYSHFIYNILKNHIADTEKCNDLLLRVGQMAFSGLHKKKIVFTDEDLMKHDLQPSQFLSGFLVELVERDDFDQKVVYTFPHLTIQEFVAALAQYLTPDPGDILKMLTEAHNESDGRFEIFLRFVVGLSSPGASRILDEFLDSRSGETACRVIDWLKERLESRIGLTWSEQGKRSLLNTLHYLFETQNSGLAQTTLGSVPRLAFGDSDSGKALLLTPIDYAVLSHAIRLCLSINELDLRNCSVQCEGLLQLEPVLNKCQVLRLEGNNLGDSGVEILSKILTNSDSKIQTVGLDNNNLTDACTKHLMSAIIENPSLTELELGYNSLGDPGAKQLFAALKSPECKIKEVRLKNNRLTSSCAEDLALTLRTNRSLTELDLGGNELGDSGVHLLCTSLMEPECKIQTLRLNNNGLTASCAESLAEVFHRNNSLKELDLGHNELGDLGIKRLSSALRESDCPVQDLRVNDNGLTASCSEDLASALRTTPSLTRLEVGNNNLGDSGVKTLSTALKDPNCKMQKLCLSKNGLTADCARDLTSIVAANPTLTELDLDQNHLGDSGVEVLSEALRKSNCNVQELSLNDNSLTASAAEHLASALGNNPSLTALSLGDNNLGDSGVKLLSEALKTTDCNIQELRLNNNGLTPSCAEDLASALVTSDTLTGLYLNDNNLGDSGVKVLNEALMHPDCKIEKLGLSGTGLTDSGSEDLMSNLSTNPKMKDVNLGSSFSSDQLSCSLSSTDHQESDVETSAAESV
ncbi:NACHT, LRR and PYD domains-containing protein 3-like isoform X2 [Hemitrygon akajei]|uniref:NACHT, LRR and PYD domains-containing protein 3-like isoform X2 n=1 Tax=Hemitrygon akajei TaxID=2704970 RepID=UPI003BF9A08A